MKYISEVKYQRPSTVSWQNYRQGLNEIPFIFCKQKERREVWNRAAKILGTGTYIHLGR